MVKVLLNFFIGSVVLTGVYSVFYFRAVPRLVAHYRKAVRSRRRFDEEIERIQKGK